MPTLKNTLGLNMNPWGTRQSTKEPNLMEYARKV